ncbi:MAG TPA: hypothetical protein VFX21_07655 [Acidimicrobiia bacterium]|nr:hypothetical protein [Acidimicrobiia bacterium]
MSRDTDTAAEHEGQLRLIPGGPRARRWALDERTRQVGRAGVAEAREILRHARPPQPRERNLSKAS